MKTHLTLFACLIILAGSLATKTGNTSASGTSLKSSAVQSMQPGEVTMDKNSVKPDSLVEASKKVLHKETKSLINATIDCIKSVCSE